MLSQGMTPTKLRERLAEHEDHIDIETYLDAVEYVRDDGRR
jgi:hypothetical protein